MWRNIVLLRAIVWNIHLLFTNFSSFNSKVYVHGITKSPTLLKEESQDAGCTVLEDVEPAPELASPVRPGDETPATSAQFVERDTGQSECSVTAAAAKTEKIMAPEEPPYFQEQW